jgi:hypothetical protein
MNLFQTLKRSRLLLAVGACTAMTLASCNQWIDTSLNNDPNNPQSVAITTLLPSTEGSLAFTNGSTVSRFACMFTQQFLGTDRQHAGYYTYLLTENDVGNIWDNYYVATMKTARTLIDQAGSGSPHYRGAGRVLFVNALATVTDTWGDVPYTEIFQLQRNGTGTLTAKFDTQESLYNVMQTQLDSAIIDLQSTRNAIALDYGVGGVAVDAIYNGDRQKWLRAAWTLKARLAIHLAKRRGNAASQDALRFLANGFKSVGDDMKFAFGTAAATPNPLYGFMRDRADITVGDYITKLLTDLKDPRAEGYGDQDNGPGPQVANSNSAVILLSFAEAKFIEAEANQRLGNTDAARTAFIAGVNASLAANGVSSDDAQTYTAQTSVVPASGITLERIMTQKYLAMYTQPETWTDWRRTGFPTLTPVTGNAIPRRLNTPLNERLYNGSNVPAGSNQPAWLFGRVWWDVQ